MDDIQSPAEQRRRTSAILLSQYEQLHAEQSLHILKKNLGWSVGCLHRHTSLETLFWSHRRSAVINQLQCITGTFSRIIFRRRIDRLDRDEDEPDVASNPMQTKQPRPIGRRSEVRRFQTCGCLHASPSMRSTGYQASRHVSITSHVYSVWQLSNVRCQARSHVRHGDSRSDTGRSNGSRE